MKNIGFMALTVAAAVISGCGPTKSTVPVKEGS